MTGWIDTHAHIYLEEFDGDRDKVMARAWDSGLIKIFMPNVDHSTIDRMLESEIRFPGQCFPMIGLHPCSVRKDFEKELYQVESWLQKRPFAAIGEIGTDLYWDKTHWSEQQEAFKIQVGWAKQYNLAMAIHCRESLDQTLELLQPLADGELKGVFHCFTGSKEQASKIIEMGFFLGIGGVATFRNGGLDKVLQDISIDSIVLETDSPYLAPVPHRGKRNEPSFIPIIAGQVGLAMKMPVEKILEITAANSNRLFS